MKHNGLSTTAVFIVAVISFLVVPFAHAQLEEITVTATKREENLQQVPIAITAFSGQDLIDRSAYKLTDITSAVPGVNLTETNNTENSNSFTIRGLNTTFNNPGIAPGVGIYVDGVYLARNAAFESALYDIRSVEVLKGPQGTLFGKNTIQGAINIVTKKPGNEFEATLSGTLGNYDLWQARASVSGPLAPGKAYGSLTLYGRDRDGTVDDIAQNTTLNGQGYHGGRAKLYLTPTDNLDITVSIDGQKDDTSSQTTDQFPIDYVVSTSGVFDGEPQVFERDVFGGSIELTYQLGEYEITSVTGARSFEHLFSNDQDFSPLRIIDRTSRVESADWYSEELRIASPAGRSFDWVAGVYAYSQEGDTQVLGDFGPDFVPGLFFVVNSDHEVDSYAVFANGNWHPTDRLTVNLGLRYTWEDQSFDFEQTSNFIANVPRFQQEISSNELSPTISFIYHASDDINTYVKYARGFKSGGFNNTAAFGSAAEITAVEPEFVDSYEIGLKGSFLENRLRTNIAAFYLEYKDRQVSSFINPIIGFAFANAAESNSQGFEFELVAEPIDDLTLQFGVGFNEGDFDRFLDCRGPGTDCTGNPIGTPNLNVSGSVSYLRELARGMSWSARIDAYHQDEADIDTSAGQLPGEERTLLNARFGLISANSDWEVALWGRNLTEDDGTIYVSSFIGELTGGLPDPRTYGIDVTFNF